jgi:diguanylate cyclase (GGDEF)-like protein
MKNEKLPSGTSPTLESERLRLETLAMLGLLDSAAERSFDVLISMARRNLGCTIALLSLIDSDRQWFKARCGLDAAETPRQYSFCSSAIELDEPLIVPNATKDPRFSTNPLVLGPPHIRFYAGVQVYAKTAYGSEKSIAIGTVCVIDDKPRILTGDELQAIKEIAHLVEAMIEARLTAQHTLKIAQRSDALVQLLSREQRQMKQAERMANIGSWRLRLADNQTEWSEQVFAIHEVEGEMPPLDAALNFHPPHARETVSGAVAQTMRTGQPFDFETDLQTAKGKIRRVRCLGELEYHEGKPVAVIGVLQDISDRYEMEQTLRRLASTDDLTQIPNRAHCELELDQRIIAARRHGADLALLLIDLDGFKAINDQCGHHAGDEVLKLIGARLKTGYLADCFIARLGGDEFVVIVSSQADCRNLDRLVERLLLDLRLTVKHGPSELNISATIGICHLDETVETRSDLMQRADIALYAAKRSQRGSAKVYTAPSQS